MSQHDMIIANDTGANVRSDLNNALQALASTSKGNSAPATPYAGQLWVDDNTPSSSVWTLSMYDGTDWIVIGYFDTTNNIFIPPIGGGTATVASSSTVDLGATQQSVVTISGTTTITSFGSSMLPGQTKLVVASGAWQLTYNGTSMILNTGAANYTAAAGDVFRVTCVSSGNYRVTISPLNGTTPGGALHKVIATTYDISTASGTQSITGVGFKPKMARIIAGLNASASISWGMDDGVTPRCWYNTTTSFTVGNDVNAINITTGAGSAQAYVSSFDADGCTLTWTKTGSPTGTAALNIEFSR